MRWARALSLLAVPCVGTLFAVACGNVNAHVFEGEQYLPTGCLSQGLAIAVVTGQSAVPGCAPVCLVYSDDAGIDGVDTYISSECPPYPYTFDAGAGQCAAALAAFEAGYFCSEDGAAPPGQSPPTLSSDGSSDASSADSSSAVDASSDADSGGPTEDDAGLPDGQTDG